MIDRIRAYLEHAFADAPKTRRVEDLRENTTTACARGCRKRMLIML